jgi:hypothetical protein
VGGGYIDPSLTLPVPTRSWILVLMTEGKRGSCISGVTLAGVLKFGFALFIYLVGVETLYPFFYYLFGGFRGALRRGVHGWIRCDVVVTVAFTYTLMASWKVEVEGMDGI